MSNPMLLHGSKPFKHTTRKTYKLSAGVKSIIVLGSFILAFALLYAEDRFFLFGISLSNLWKFGLVGLSFVYVLIRFGSKIPPFFLITSGVLISLAINGNSTFSMDDLERIFVFLVMPLSYYTWYYYSFHNLERLKYILICLSIFFLVSTIPFILGWVQPVETLRIGLSSFAESYNLESNMLIGFFKHPAISSKVFVLSVAVIFSLGYMNNKISPINKIWLLLIILLGFYCLYLSFTRTGWLMMALFFSYYILNAKSLGPFKKIIGAILIFSTFYYLLINNDAFYSRIFGIREGAISSANIITEVSSGRNTIYFSILELIFRGDALTFYFGFGSEAFNELNFGAAAHNLFLEYFAVGGLISLVLYVIWYLMLYREILRSNNNMSISSSVFALFYISLVGSLISHGFGFYGSILFGGLLAYNRLLAKKNS